ncbi:hypothetical protein LTR84_008932 [Exophiala bonariae]|uniref:ADP-ribosylation factor n=1 Tax=Exophiala bonariae TaxID=1690606 RepID=A0AAV9MWE7_9EURO|nr:hypothetical protein LTR84_008932 [Exophiala bonariae]
MAQAPAPPNAKTIYDLDQKGEYDECYNKLKDPTTGNFAVSFDKNEAKCAVDLDEATVLSWLENDSRPANKTLWLNFWLSGAQRATIKAIAAKYELSPRLTGLLCPPESPAPKSGTAGSTTTATDSSDDSSAGSTAKPGKGSHTTQVDEEKGMTPGSQTLQQPAGGAAGFEKPISFGDVVNDLWHFNSVDFGSHYIYVGFNALFTVPGLERSQDDKPSGIRIWSSLLICDDGTIVSVFQRPDINRPEAHAAARQNALNVFKHLSKQHIHDPALDALMKVGVRWYEHSKKSDDASYATEAASLLFYYLFDDWRTTYSLIARRAHPYRTKLENLRKGMLESAEVNLISQIHNLGRQLTVLKLMYQSYEHIVSRLLYWSRAKKDTNLAMLSSRPTLPSLDAGEYQDMTSSQLVRDERIFLEDESDCRVKLYSSSIARFERLLGRIRLYALTEIDECLNEKESLVLMVSCYILPLFRSLDMLTNFQNFNLVALKESQAVERLTRTTILLAKATILFLPVSLMTAYFSIQLPEIAEMYSLKTYWLSFLVVAVLSVAFLLVFGVTTHTVEGKTIYKSLTRMILDKGKSSKKKKH